MTEAHGVACSVCGKVQPRSEMFGVEPDLVCPDCAERVRERYARRLAPLRRFRPPIVTSAVVAVAGLLFVAAHVLKMDWVGALVEDGRIWQGELWRLVTSAFLHTGPAFGTTLVFGLLHVGLNGLAIWQLGRWIEGTWGSLAMAGLVLGGAVAASAVSWAVSGPAVGLSGAVFALAGFLFPLRKVHATAAAVMNPRTVNSILTWFILCIVLSETGTVPISNWGHGGGLAWGLLAGLAVRHRLRRVWVAGVALLTVAMLLAAQHVAFGEQAAWRDQIRRYERYLEDWRRPG